MPPHAADCSGAGGEKAGLAAVGAASTEIDHLAAFGGGVNAGRFAGDHGLVAHSGEDVGLHDLAFDDRSHDAEHRFAREDQGAFGHSPDVASETEGREVIEEFVANVAKYRVATKVIDLFRREMDVFEEFEGLFEAGGDKIVAMGRKVADEQFESGAGVKAGLQIARSHGEFVEVG